MRHQVGGNQRDALGVAHQRLQRGPLGLDLFLAALLLALSDFIKLGVEFRQGGGVQAQLGDAAFVINRHRGLVRHSALNVVYRNVVAEHRARVGIGFLDRRAGKADERRLRQCIAHVAGEAVDHVILAAVGFVGDDDDVAPVAQTRHLLARLYVGRQKFLNGSEHHTAACHRQ